ncbi:MAG TPA: 3-phosphoglycerate dehydrogenase [Candidatus Tetragenococcus pullicola]|nr:3-phosphoglycerate dehydrogenase [Candidatus Tetragenococcus pullicola]
MFHIQTYNDIAPQGLKRFDSEFYKLNEKNEPDGILLRSQNLLTTAFPSSVCGIARAGAGINNIPVSRCSQEGIVVFNTPGANANAVKELVLASLLLCVRPIIQGVNWLKRCSGADISQQVEANKKQFVGHELEGKKLGVIGLGAIGAMVANDAYRLGMEVVGYDPYVSVDTAWSISRRVKRATDMNELLKTCDFITVHVPLKENTYHLIDEKQLAQMKNTAYLLNFARGEIVSNEAIKKAIADNRLAGYLTDFADESLIGNEKILVFPHLGASTEEAEVNCAKMAVRTLKRFLETGEIKRSVNFPTVEMAFHSSYRLTMIHQNIPNMLGIISSAIAQTGINIDNMINRGQGEVAYTLVDIDETNPEKIATIKKQLEKKAPIIRVRALVQKEVIY